MFSNALRSSTRLARLCSRSTSSVETFSVSSRGFRLLSPAFIKPSRSFSIFHASRQNEDRHDLKELLGVSDDGTQGPAPSRTLYIGNLPYSVDEHDLRDLLEPISKIAMVRIAYEGGRARGFAHVDFESEEGAARVLETVRDEPLLLQERTLTTGWAARGRKTPQRAERPPSDRLYFHSFPGERAEMENMLRARGFDNTRVTSIFFFDTPRRDGARGGFLRCVDVDTAAEVIRALNESTQSGDGRLYINYAVESERPRAPRTPRRPWEEEGRDGRDGRGPRRAQGGWRRERTRRDDGPGESSW